METDDYKNKTNRKLIEHYSFHLNRLKDKEAYLKKINRQPK